LLLKYIRYEGKLSPTASKDGSFSEWIGLEVTALWINAKSLVEEPMSPELPKNYFRVAG